MPISTLKIDPRLLPIDWQTATTYTIVVGSDFVREVGNNRAPSPERTATITTYASGPVVASVSPEFGAVDSSVLTATVTLNRPIEVIPDSGNFYLYKVVEGGPNELIATIPIGSNRITISGKDARVSFVDLIEPNETYYLTSDLGLFADIFGFPSSGLEEGVFNYTIGGGPELASSFPAYDQDDAFVSTATITYDRPVFINTGNFYLNTASGVARTIPASQVEQIGTGTIAITLYDQVIVEDTYHITHDLNAVKSTQGIPHARIVDDSFLRWDNKSLSDQPDQEYDSQTLTELFPDWWDILDRDPDPDKEYALRMFANSGTFVVNGDQSDDLFVRFGTRTELEALDADIIQFNADVKDMNWDLPLTTTLMKDATVIATRQNTLIGKPFDLASLVLVSNTFTNSVGSSTVLTVTANTNSSITSEVTFKTSSIVFGTSTFVNNVATLTLQPDTLSAGTYNIFADWDGQTIVPKFNGRDSNSIEQRYLNRSNVDLSLTDPIIYFKNNEEEFSISEFSTASVEISNIYPTHLPSGTAQLFEGDTLLSTGQIQNGEGSLTWNPGDFDQIDQGEKVLTVRYLGDSWNNTGTNNFVFIGQTKRFSPAIFLTLSTATVMKKVPFLAITTGSNFFDGKIINVNGFNGTITSVTFNNTSAVATINGSNLDLGANELNAAWDGSWGYYSTSTNNANIDVTKFSTPFTLAINTSSQFRPVNFNIMATSVLPYYDGEEVTFFNGVNILGTATFVNNNAILNVPSSQTPLGNYSILATIPEDSINFANTSSNSVAFTLNKTTNNIALNTPSGIFRRPAAIPMTVTSVLAFNQSKIIELVKDGSVFDTISFVGPSLTRFYSSSDLNLGTSTFFVRFIEDNDYVGVQSAARSFILEKGVWPQLTLTASTSTADVPFLFSLTASSDITYHEGKTFEFYDTVAGLIGSATVINGSATLILDPRNFSLGTRSFFARSIEDNNYYFTQSNNVSVFIQDRTAISITFTDEDFGEPYQWEAYWGDLVPQFEVRPSLLSFFTLTGNQNFYKNETLEFYNQAGKIVDVPLANSGDGQFNRWNISLASTTFDEIDNDFYFKWSSTANNFSTQTNVISLKVYDSYPPELTITSPDITDNGFGVLSIVYQRPETAVIQVVTTSSYYNEKPIELWFGQAFNPIPTKQYITSSTVVNGVATFELDSNDLPLGRNYFVARFSGENNVAPQIATTSGFFFTDFNFSIRIDE